MFARGTAHRSEQPAAVAKPVSEVMGDPRLIGIVTWELDRATRNTEARNCSLTNGLEGPRSEREFHHDGTSTPKQTILAARETDRTVLSSVTNYNFARSSAPLVCRTVEFTGYGRKICKQTIKHDSRSPVQFMVRRICGC